MIIYARLTFYVCMLIFAQRGKKIRSAFDGDDENHRRNEECIIIEIIKYLLLLFHRWHRHIVNQIILQIIDSSSRFERRRCHIQITMNCNRYRLNKSPANRCESCFERKNDRHLEPKMRLSFRRLPLQETSLLGILFSLTIVVCCITRIPLDGGDMIHKYNFGMQPTHAFVAQNAVRRRTNINMASITTMRARSLPFSSFVTLQHRNRSSAQRNYSTRSKQQADGDVEIDRDNDGDLPRFAKTKILQASMGTENNAKSTRRWFLAAAGTPTGLAATTSILSPFCSIASAVNEPRSGSDGTTIAAAAPMARVFEYTEDNQTAITVPLAFTGQELLVAYKVDGSTFKAVLDTGSPFLMIPGSCGENTRKKAGCYRNQGIPVPKLTPTIEIFDGFQGEVNWRSALFEFWDVNNNDSINNYVAAATAASTASVPTLQTQQRILSTDTADDSNDATKKPVIFGVASEAIMGGPGGVFFGMIRDTDARIRPSFLGQTGVRAFRVNLATQPRTLTLSNRDLIATTSDDGTTSTLAKATAVADYIPMTNILRRKFGDPVGHYTASAQSIFVDGYPLVDTTIDKNSKILVIFDTGVTGMVVSRGLFDEQYTLARKRRAKTLFGNVELKFSTELGKESILRATKPLATPFDPEQTWKKFPKRREGKKSTVHIIVMGLAFLEGRSLTVDIDGERISVE